MPTYNILGIDIWIPDLGDLVDIIDTPLTNTIWGAVGYVDEILKPSFDAVTSALSPLINGVTTAILSFLRDPIGFISSGVGQISGAVSGLVTQLGSGISSIINNISGAVSQISIAVDGFIDVSSSALNGAISSVGSALNEAIDTTRGVLENAIDSTGALLSGAIESAEGVMLTAFDGMGDAISGVIGGMFHGFGFVDAGEAGNAINVLSQTSQASLNAALERHSPMTPVEAYNEALTLRNVQRDVWYGSYISALLIEGASLGQVDTPSAMSLSAPDIAAGLKLATEWYAAPFELGFKPLLERYYNMVYEPNIPDFNTMISIYVKEGYMEDHHVEIPDGMLNDFTELGYNSEWAKKIWGAHWQYPAATQLFEMLHRTAGNFPEIGVTDEVLRTMLKLHDYEPKWRAPLEAISWNTWRIFDIRTAWEMQLVDDIGLEKRLIDTGYEPNDAKLLALVQKMFVLRSEIDGMVTECTNDYTAGWINEDQLRADLEATPYNRDVIELRISKAKVKRDRQIKADLLTALTNRYVKGDLSSEEYTTELSRLGMSQDFIQTQLKKADATKLKKVTEDTATTSKSLTEEKYSRSYHVGLLTEEAYRKKLEALKFSEEDMDLLVELNAPEKPKPEEIKQLTVAELKAAFRIGIIAEGQFRDELTARRYSDADINVLVETEKAKIKPAEGVAA
jgi:hypothetical protein